MEIWQSLLLGIIQGLTEFLPVSSSGHLLIMKSVFGTDLGGSALAFDVLLHLGTLCAVFIAYRKDIIELIKAFFTLCGKLFHGKFKLSDYTVAERMVIYVIIATLPLVPAALLEEYVTGISVWAVGLILILNAAMLFFSDRFAKENVEPDGVRPRNAVAVGLVQMLALLPGLSRSGSTITAGLTQGFRREYAVKFSFILSIPAILGACVLKLPDFVRETLSSGDTALLFTYFAGAVAAGIVGLCAIKLLQFIAKKSNFKMFAYYCVAMGVFAIVWGILN